MLLYYLKMFKILQDLLSLENIVDNALVLGNMNHVILNVMGEEAPTNVSVADGAWHHVAVVWSSKNGKYKAFKDGIKVAEDENFQKGRVSFIKCNCDNVDIKGDSNNFNDINVRL